MTSSAGEIIEWYEGRLAVDCHRLRSANSLFFVRTMLINSSDEELKVILNHVGEKIEDAISAHKQRVLRTDYS